MFIIKYSLKLVHFFGIFSKTISSVEPSKEKYSGRNGFPRDSLDSSAEQPSFSKEPENWEILIICLGITSGLMAFLTVFSAFKYQFLKSWPAEKKKNQVVEAETQAFYGVKFEALKQHDMTTDEHEQEDDKTTRLVCKWWQLHKKGLIQLVPEKEGCEL